LGYEEYVAEIYQYNLSIHIFDWDTKNMLQRSINMIVEIPELLPGFGAQEQHLSKNNSI
jgi:hypothetical protein